MCRIRQGRGGWQCESAMSALGYIITMSQRIIISVFEHGVRNVQQLIVAVHVNPHSVITESDNFFLSPELRSLWFTDGFCR
jgi:hypothetical protein